MEKLAFEKEFIKQIAKLGIEIQDEQIEQMYQHMNLLLEWNNKMNLTAITEEREIIQKHFVDSLTIVKTIDTNSCIIDVGTGAGFPGIPLKIMRKDVSITLLDSLKKRIGFLQEVIEQLHLEKVEAIHARAEEFGKNKNHRERYDVATSRAVANLSTLVEYLLPLVKVGGICLCMKGPDIEQELKKSQKAIQVLGGKLEKVEEFVLPNSDIKRSIVMIRKVLPTSEKYPRKAGIPAKEPI